jgi:uncharacterized protein (TIGR03067 family)
MPPFTITLALLGVSALCAAGRGEEKPVDLRKLSGKWDVQQLSIGTTSEGDAVPTEIRAVAEITPGGRFIISVLDSKLVEWSIEVDVRKSPVWIDLTLVSDDNMKLKGLVELKGDTLVIHARVGDRPAKLEEKLEDDSFLIRCKRAK